MRTSSQSPPAGPANQQAPAFDPRLNNLVLTFVVAGVGGAASVHDAALEVVNGQGQVWLEPAGLPPLGEITTGRLIIASENFPAYAPLTLHLRGLELRFLAEGGNLISGGFYAAGRSLLRLQWSGALHPSLIYALHWPAERRLLIRRFDLLAEHSLYELELEVLDGAVRSDRPRLPSLELGDRVRYNRLHIAPRDGQETLTLRLIAARFVLEFHNGQVRLIRAFSSLGFIGAFAVRDVRRFGTSLSVAFREVVA